MRGIPDEFNGNDKLIKQNNLLPNRTVSVDLSTQFEKFGFEKFTPIDTTAFSMATLNINGGLTINYNNYSGFSLSSNISVASSISKSVAGGKTTESNQSISLSSSDEGLSISPNLSFSKTAKNNEDKDVTKQLNIGLNFNSRGGLQGLSFGMKKNKIDATQLGRCINIGLSSHKFDIYP
jgi:hypothetical protein